jgi:hypothetical protein
VIKSQKKVFDISNADVYVENKLRAKASGASTISYREK